MIFIIEEWVGDSPFVTEVLLALLKGFHPQPWQRRTTIVKPRKSLTTNLEMPHFQI
jgi:hypothetical protein